jgi:hypothetical protein
MKFALFLLVSLLAATPLFAQAATATQSTTETASPAQDQAQEKPVADVYPRWSIVGDWRVTHPDWTGVLTIRADGTLSNSIRATGRWLLASDAGTPLLVIRWDLFGTESLSMVTADHFRGQKRKGRFIDMRRGDEAATTKPKGNPEDAAKGVPSK